MGQASGKVESSRNGRARRSVAKFEEPGSNCDSPPSCLDYVQRVRALVGVSAAATLACRAARLPRCSAVVMLGCRVGRLPRCSAFAPLGWAAARLSRRSADWTRSIDCLLKIPHAGKRFLGQASLPSLVMEVVHERSGIVDSEASPASETERSNRN